MNPAQYSIATAPTSEPVSFDEMADHLRLIGDDDEGYVTGLISVAREYIESVTGRATMSATYRVVAPTWDDLRNTMERIPLFRTPLVSITSIKYYPPVTATRTTWSSANYYAITATSPGQVFIPSSVSLPDVEEERPDAIEILFVAGHSTVAEVPPMMRHAIKLMAAHLYENRSPYITGTIVNAMPMTLTSLIQNQRIGGNFR